MVSLSTQFTVKFSPRIVIGKCFPISLSGEIYTHLAGSPASFANSCVFSVVRMPLRTVGLKFIVPARRALSRFAATQLSRQVSANAATSLAATVNHRVFRRQFMSGTTKPRDTSGHALLSPPLVIRNSDTLKTITMPVGLRFEGMSPQADRLAGVMCRRAFPAQNVDLYGHKFDMYRVSAVSTPAQMIARQFFVNRAHKHATRRNVSKSPNFLSLESSVAVEGLTDPKPARDSLVDNIWVYLNVTKEVFKKFQRGLNSARICSDHFGLRDRLFGLGCNVATTALCPSF